MSTAHCTAPQHVAIIMDGNGRWAEQKGKPRTYGHRHGYRSVMNIVKHASTLGIKSLTLYAFSSENWSRPEREVTSIMILFRQAIRLNRRLFLKNNLRFNVIGDTTAFSEALQQDIERLQQETKNNTGMTVNVAANYGAKWELTQAVQHLAKNVQNGSLEPHNINEASITAALSMPEQSEIDLLIRTGGEIRISNFLLWQCAYAEFYFTPTFWPDFNEQAFDAAITEFTNRCRRYGSIHEA